MAVGETPWAWMRGLAPAAVLTLACAGAAVAQAPPIPPKTPPALEAIRQRDQRDRELEAVRSEQQKAAETEQKLTVESESLSEDRRRLNQSLIETAARIRAGEERTAAAEIRLRELDGREAEIRKSLEGRRAFIAEVLAALQRIGHRPPPAVFAGAEDAIESVRAAMSLGAVLPQMRSEAERLKGELSELTRVKKEEADERSALAVRLADLAEAQRGMAALIEERQKAAVRNRAGDRQRAPTHRSLCRGRPTASRN